MLSDSPGKDVQASTGTTDRRYRATRRNRLSLPVARYCAPRRARDWPALDTELFYPNSEVRLCSVI